MAAATLPKTDGPHRAPARRWLARHRSRVVNAAILGGVTLAVWLVAFASAAMGAGDTRAPRVQDLVIPPGTSVRIAQGENPLSIPPSWDFVAGDTLRLVNDDVAIHRIGPWQVPPHATRSIRFSHPTSGSFACSVHPSGQLAIDVQPRGVDFGLTLVPTAVLGPGIGLVLIGLRSIMRRIDRA